MKVFPIALLLLLGLTFISSEITPSFPGTQPIKFGTVKNTVNTTGSVLPCNTVYYRFQTINNTTPNGYLKLTFTQQGEPDYANFLGTMYLASSSFSDLQAELTSNTNIVDTLGGLPGPNNYLYSCNQAVCYVELSNCELEETTYYLAITGSDAGVLFYTFNAYLNNVSIFEVYDKIPQPILYDRRPTTPPIDHIFYYRYFAINIPESSAVEGTYLVVNLSRADPGVQLQLQYGGLPELAVDTGVIGQVDYNSNGTQSDNCIFQYCVNTTLAAGQPYYSVPVSSMPIIPCVASTEVQFLDADSFQYTTNLTVSPCQFLYGTWYISVLLPARAAPSNPEDLSGYVNYTLTAFIMHPDVVALKKNTTTKGAVFPDAASHYAVNIPSSEYVIGETRLFVQISNIRNGHVNVYIHQAQSALLDSLAGGLESCAPANVSCYTDAACNLVVEKCHFQPGVWYIAVYVAYDELTNEFEVEDYSRLPITYTLRADWVEDPVPVVLTAGVPAISYIGEAIYDFYVINIPSTIDTFLFVELFVKSYYECDTGVTVSVLHGALPGGECYANPDFYCMTGDPRGLSYTTGPATNYFQQPIARQSCNFMIQTCELQSGPLYLSVYGHHLGYALFSDNTYYQLPVQYTLYVDFDVALAVQSALSYSESVFENQYQHYYLRVDYAAEGSYLSVEACNIQHGIPQTLQLYVNYNYLAGNCPCYDHLYNATGVIDPTVFPIFNDFEPEILPELLSVTTCATVIVPACEFRPGVWYVGVQGLNQDTYQYTTPIGYTLTVTVQDPPTFTPLILSQPLSGAINQYNITYQYDHYYLAAAPLPNHDLVFKFTYLQNCQYQGIHSNWYDSLVLFVNQDAPAGDRCYAATCAATIDNQSHCTIVIPACEWTGTRFFAAVKGDFVNAQFLARYTLEAHVREVRDYQLTSGVAVTDRVGEGLYKHFFLDVEATKDEYLSVFYYSNNDQDLASVYLNLDNRAGDVPCYSSLQSCIQQSFCFFQVESYQLLPGRYYLSVYGGAAHFYDVDVEFSLTASTLPVVSTLIDGEPITGAVELGEIQHYLLEIGQIGLGDFLSFQVEVGCSNGAVTAYYQFDSLAGRVPGYLHSQSCSASPLGTQWCEIRVPACEFVVGRHFFSIVGAEYTASYPPYYPTPIGYTLQAEVVSAPVVQPVVQVGRFDINYNYAQQVGNERFVHYQFPVLQSDIDAGVHWIVEITNVQAGSLSVYYQPGAPADSAEGCYLAEICTTGVSQGLNCYWQIPFSTVQYDAAYPDYYISVEALTGRVLATYDILIYKQAVPVLQANPTFTLDNKNSSAQFAFGTELNVTHYAYHEPNGWTQFVQLAQVPPATDAGQMLEVFFYRIINNVGQPMSFNVYLFPDYPAGAHECCEADPGSCQGAPTLRSVELTTQATGGVESLSYTCDLGFGVGPDATGLNAFYGERCTVRVWPCEFSKYCTNQTVNWWLSVVPIAPSNAAYPLPGLSYSVQWRTYNIRLDESVNVNTIRLDDYVDKYDFTPAYTTFATTTENEGWLSFAFTVPTKASRITIQTDFAANTLGAVYITSDKFASPPLNHQCAEYWCFSDYGYGYGYNGDYCALAGRFVSPSCEFVAGTTYYITVRNLGGAHTYLAVAFRILALEVLESHLIHNTFRPNATHPFITNAEENAFKVAGVEGENYNFYELYVDDHDLANYTSLLIDLKYINPQSLGGLTVYVRGGAKAGNYYGNYENFYTLPEGCFSYEYSCSVTYQNDLTQCTLQIPHTQLVPDHYYITVFNPNFDFGPGATQLLPNYQLTVFFQQPTVLKLNTTVQQNNATLSVQYPGTYAHYVLNITDADINYDVRTNLQGYYTDWLRIRLGNLNLTGQAVVYVNYDNLAGLNDGYTWSLTYFDSTNCDVAGCYIDVQPCGTFQLKSGLYFISVLVESATTYNISANIYNDIYTSITPTTIQGTGDRAGTTNILWRHTVTTAELTKSGDGFGNYRYVVDTNANIPDDDVIESDYFFVNLTSVGSKVAGELTLQMWRDDCSEFSCYTNTTTQPYCIVDAVSLAPCSIKGGRFYFEVINPSGVTFTLSFYQNETTVQTLRDQQVLTEIIYPYEYQEYFYVAQDVREGATLTVELCAVCGEVEAWIRPNLPAGPNPSGSGSQYDYQCALDHCYIASTADATADASCCRIFLDSCEYQQQGYYIAVRGVGTNFPNLLNPHLYLPALYQIQAFQTNIQVLDANFIVPQTVSYSQRAYQLPTQFAFDLEEANVGTSLRFSMALPYQYVPVTALTATLSVALNTTAGYTSACPNLEYTCTVESTASFYGCSFIIPPCAVSAGRYYVWADAPRGTEVVVERWEPYIPLIQTNLQYSATINAPLAYSDYIEFPFTQPVQYYRFDYGDLYDQNNAGSAHFYKKFFVRVLIQNVSQGTISASVNSGFYPVPAVVSSACDTPVFIDTTSCATVPAGYDCYIDIERPDINYFESDTQQDKFPYFQLQSTFWLVITGLAQECNLHSVQYSFTVQTSWEVTFVPLDRTVADSVAVDQYNFHRLKPEGVEHPQRSYLLVQLNDIDYSNAEQLQVYLKDQYLPTSISYDYTALSTPSATDSTTASVSFEWLCGYSNLYLSTYGLNSADYSEIYYSLNVTKVFVPVKELTLGSVYTANDDEDDMCPQTSYFIINALAANGHFDTSFLRVSVQSNFPTQVYLNQGSFAAEQCYIAQDYTNGGIINLYDFCTYADGYYYLTVESTGPYSVYADVVDSAKNLTLGEIYRDTLYQGQYQIYTLEICKDWYEPDSRLVIEVADVQNGNVYALIQLNSNPGPYQSPSSLGATYCDIPNSAATAQFFDGQSGYNFLLLDHATLLPGTYHILVQAQPHIVDVDYYNSQTDRNPSPVTYRLFPYLVRLDIAPTQLGHNLPVPGVVDFYTVNRGTPDFYPFAQYYVVYPNTHDVNGLAFAQVLLYNVTNGFLTVGVNSGHLATPQSGYLGGEIKALTHNFALPGNMQSGKYPNTYQPMLDPRNSLYQPECSGSADFCGVMNANDQYQYITNNSIAVWVPSCYFDTTVPLYIYVQASYQFYLDNSITYNLEVEQYSDYTFLKPNSAIVDSMSNNTWEHHFYRSIQAEVESAKWRVVVTEGEGVRVTVRNNRCPLQASWVKEIWCDAAYFNHKYVCEIEIPTAAAHPGDTAFFIDVYGRNATYSISYLRGLENCDSISGAGRVNGLNFCAGIVSYDVWRWDDFTVLDNEAAAFFLELYDHFRVQPCWTGVTTDCNSTLQRFACYESFKACDRYGFEVGTCRSACNAVVYECVNWFESVNLEHYNCTSSRYIDDGSFYCTGYNSFPTLQGAQNVFDDVNNILYTPENHVFLNQKIEQEVFDVFTRK